MTRNEALREIDSHLSSLSSAAHSKLSMPEVKMRRRQLHVWRAQVDAAHDGDRVLDEIVDEIYESDPVKVDQQARGHETRTVNSQRSDAGRIPQ